MGHGNQDTNQSVGDKAGRVGCTAAGGAAAKKAGLPGSIYLNNGRYYWRVVLPGDSKRQAIALIPRGAGHATRDFGVAVEVAKDILAKAIFKERHPAGASGSGSGGGSALDETVAGLVTRYPAHADRYYRKTDGTPTSEPALIRCALNRLVDHCAAHEAQGIS